VLKNTYVHARRHCEERSDEAIQEPPRFLDCFAPLAMTEDHSFTFADVISFVGT
jgi:hypothetical protein